MSAPQTFNLQIDAGVYTEETERGAMGRWFNANKVRFRKGLPEKIGGWQRLDPQFLGICRKIIDWSSLDGRKWTALGTDIKLYLWQNSALYDITPIRRTVTLGTDPFAVVDTSATVTVTDTANGAQVGDYVRFSGATAGGGITIDGEYRITEILTPNTYTIEHSTEATSTDATTGGAAVEAEYDISIGSESTFTSTGYSTGGYSSGGYSEPITSSETIVSARTWSLDTWGEDLIASPNGGAIYWWDRTNGPEVRSVILDEVGTPHINGYVMVAQSSRQLISLGAYDNVNTRADPLLIRWCSQENFDDWLPTAVNTAGDIRVYNGSKFISGIRTKSEIVIFTDTSVHSLVSLGAAGFAPVTLGENVSILGPNAAVAVDHRIFFMAEADFYIYDGVLRPLPCDVRNHVYDNLTIAQKIKVFAGANRSFNEVWWFYPARPSEVWFDGDFAIDDESVEMEMQGIGEVPLWAADFWSDLFWAEDFWTEDASATPLVRYVVEHNAAGFIELTEVPDSSSVYDAVYLMNSGAVIQNFESVEYDMSFSLTSMVDMDVGFVFHVTDLHAVEDTAADNIQGLAVEINPATNRIRFVSRLSDGTWGGFLTNDILQDVQLDSLPEPVTLTAGVHYTVTVQRNDATLSMYFIDEDANTTQLCNSFDLTAAEQLLFTSGTAGPLFAGIASVTPTESVLQVYSFRVAELGTLITEIEESGVTTYERSRSDEIGRYVIFNYEENTWSIGTMVRTAWNDRSPVLEKPYAAGIDGYLYQHETGADDVDDPLPSFIESYMMEIPDAGENMMHVDQLIPDFLRLDGSVSIKLRGRRYPQDQRLIEKGPFNIVNGTETISPRMKARQISLRIESSAVGDRWRAGRWRGRATAHGKR